MKSYTAKQIVAYLQNRKKYTILKNFKLTDQSVKRNQEYQIWQEGSHPQLIQSREMMIQKIEYIHNNPVRRGYIEKPYYWRYSSASNYHNGDGLLEIITSW